MIYVECTCSWHHQRHCELWNIESMCCVCEKGCGLIVPAGLDICNLTEDIPELYIDSFTDLSWFKFKKTIKLELENWNKYKNKWTRIDDQRYGTDEDELYWKLTKEQQNARHYSSLNFCKFI